MPRQQSEESCACVSAVAVGAEDGRGAFGQAVGHDGKGLFRGIEDTPWMSRTFRSKNTLKRRRKYRDGRRLYKLWIALNTFRFVMLTCGNQERLVPGQSASRTPFPSLRCILVLPLLRVRTGVPVLF